MADQSLLETILRLNVDAGAAARTVASIAKVENAMDDLRATVAKQDAIALKNINTLKQQASAAQSAAAQFDEVSKKVALAGDVQSNLGALRGLASVAGASGLGAGIGTAGEIVALAEELPRLKAALAGMPDVAKAAADAIGVGVVGGVGLVGALSLIGATIALIQRQSEEAKAAIDRQLEAAYNYNNVVAFGTQESIDKQIELNEAKQAEGLLNLRTAEKVREEAQAALDAYNAIPNESAGNFQLVAALNAAEEAYEQAGIAVVKLQTEEIDLRRARDDAGVTARTAADAERSLAAERQLLVDQLADVQIRALISATSSSSDATNKRMEAIRNEIEVTQRFLDAGGLSVEKTDELTNRITLLSQELVTLNLEVLPVIQARERETAALAYQKKQLEDTAAAVQKYNEDVAAIEQRNLEARQQASERYYDRVTAIAEAAAQAAENALRQLQQRRADLARDLARAGEDAETERRRDELDAQVDFQRDEAKAAREHAEELKRIRRQALRDETQAVQDRDAVALDAAQTRKRDEIHDAHENYQQAARERRIAFNQEASDRRVAFERERQDRLLKYQRDLADAQAAYQQDLAFAAQKRQQDLIQAQAAYRQDLATLQQKYTQELTARRNAAVAELRLIQQTESQRVQIMAQAQQALINQARALLTTVGASAASSIPLSGGVGNAPFPAPPQLASGGHITRTGLALVHKGETIINPARGQSAGSSVILNLNGMQAKEIDVRSKQHAIDTVVTVLQEML